MRSRDSATVRKKEEEGNRRWFIGSVHLISAKMAMKLKDVALKTYPIHSIFLVI